MTLRLFETTDKEFLDGVEDLYNDWKEVQENIPTATEERDVYGYYFDEKTQDYEQDWYKKDVTYQTTAGEEKPAFTEESPGYYDREHPAERRVKYGQTKKEINVERELMRLWQKHADIKFFKSNKLTYVHDTTYKSAARAMGNYGVKITPPKESDIFAAQNQAQKNAISVTATYNPDGQTKIGSQFAMGKGWGYTLKGHPIFAAFTDLASQTQRMATDAAREYYKSSGLPKRASIARAAENPNKKASRKRALTRQKKRKGMSDDAIEKYFKIHANAVALNEKDMQERGANLEEVILDNWTIDYWYISNFYQASRFFREHLKAGKFTRPILVVDEAYSGAQLLTKFNPQKQEDVEKLLSLFDKEQKRR